MEDELFKEFLEESQALLNDLKELGQSLKNVGVPSEDEAKKLNEFAQKLNRLVGGTAAMGFGMFSPLSRKTSLLASRCAHVREITIRTIIQNLNIVVSVFSMYFIDIDSLQELEVRLPDLEKRIDICMTSLGMESPDIKSQDEIDDIMSQFR